MASGHFMGFFRNALFDKRSVLRGLRGRSPPFFHDPPDRLGEGGVWGLSGGGAAGIDGGDAGPGICITRILIRTAPMRKIQD
jgi:hypothetical protein